MKQIIMKCILGIFCLGYMVACTYGSKMDADKRHQIVMECDSVASTITDDWEVYEWRGQKYSGARLRVDLATEKYFAESDIDYSLWY